MDHNWTCLKSPQKIKPQRRHLPLTFLYAIMSSGTRGNTPETFHPIQSHAVPLDNFSLIVKGHNFTLISEFVLQKSTESEEVFFLQLQGLLIKAYLG